MINLENNSIFTAEVSQFVRSSFFYLEKDIFENPRLFFENSGGSLRLKTVVEEDAKFAAYPDCPERTHQAAKLLGSTLEKGIEDIRLFLNAKEGSIITSLTASKVIFEIIGAISENVPGNNIVTTSIEHPSSFDACKMYAEKTNKELRVAKANPQNGGVDTEEIISLIDKNTSLLSVILTSNLTGTILDIEKIVKQARQINPEIYIVVDAVQAAPHSVIDVERLKIDGLNIAPYKMFGNRGVAFGYVSDRVASLPHQRLLAADKKNWKLGSPAPAHFAAFTKIIDYICTIGAFYNSSNDRRKLIVEGMSRIHQQEQTLLKRMISGTEKTRGLKNIPGLTVHFMEETIKNKDLIVALSFDNSTCTEAVKEYAEQNILVYDRVDSSYYSQRILHALNLKGIIRVSPLHCHTFNEIDQFLEATYKIANNS